MRKNVLIFTYYWPPASGPGVWRFLKFAKYLPEFGWNPIIITVKEGAFATFDPSLEKEIPDTVRVIKTKSFDPYRLYNALQGKSGKNQPEAMSGIKESTSLFQQISKHIRANYFVPDPKIGWVPYAFKEAAKIVETEDVHAIISTGPPHSAHLAALKIKKKYNIPWIMDFRDPWTTSYLNTEFLIRKDSVNQKDKKLEDQCVAAADIVVGIGPGLVSEFADRAKRTEAIFNGFDESDFASSANAETMRSELFRLSYIGSVKPNQDVTALWDVLVELKSEIPDFENVFKLSFVGNLNPYIEKSIRDRGLSSILETHGFIPHDQALKKIRETQLLLFIVPHAAAYSKSITSGKVFEYMASHSPMLSIGPPDGDAAWIVSKGGRDQMIDYSDGASMKREILKYFGEWRDSGGIVQKQNGGDYMFFSRKRLTEKLAELLEEIST